MILHIVYAYLALARADNYIWKYPKVGSNQGPSDRKNLCTTAPG